MLTPEKFKKSLGEEAKNLTEEEIVKLRDQMDQLADIFFDMWLEDIKKGKG